MERLPLQFQNLFRHSTLALFRSPPLAADQPSRRCGGKTSLNAGGVWGEVQEGRITGGGKQILFSLQLLIFAELGRRFIVILLYRRGDECIDGEAPTIFVEQPNLLSFLVRVFFERGNAWESLNRQCLERSQLSRERRIKIFVCFCRGGRLQVIGSRFKVEWGVIQLQS